MSECEGEKEWIANPRENMMVVLGRECSLAMLVIIYQF